jgi:hypothetical protein
VQSFPDSAFGTPLLLDYMQVVINQKEGERFVAAQQFVTLTSSHQLCFHINSKVKSVRTFYIKQFKLSFEDQNL